ncbi:hypothetical protein BDN72DRAFT_901137 [Pluteus cervinus]|uniref:Uncharacterized protein n=1 Tax=Pluteus cervinus TaxID=181527 RepID=A0ACD3AHA2_9AGAR|nr:hypothetical protein BDN72DRAFT_901137 [Pluteus cervinus]
MNSTFNFSHLDKGKNRLVEPTSPSPYSSLLDPVLQVAGPSDTISHHQPAPDTPSLTKDQLKMLLGGLDHATLYSLCPVYYRLWELYQKSRDHATVRQLQSSSSSTLAHSPEVLFIEEATTSMVVQPGAKMVFGPRDTFLYKIFGDIYFARDIVLKKTDPKFKNIKYWDNANWSTLVTRLSTRRQLTQKLKKDPTNSDANERMLEKFDVGFAPLVNGNLWLLLNKDERLVFKSGAPDVDDDTMDDDLSVDIDLTEDDSAGTVKRDKPGRGYAPLQELDGKAITKGDVGEIGKFINTLLDQLAMGKDLKLLGDCWGKVPADVKALIFRALENRFPVYAFCSGHWKAHATCQDAYYNWSRNNLPSKKRTSSTTKEGPSKKPRLDQEVIELNDDDDSEASNTTSGNSRTGRGAVAKATSASSSTTTPTTTTQTPNPTTAAVNRLKDPLTLDPTLNGILDDILSSPIDLTIPTSKSATASNAQNGVNNSMGSPPARTPSPATSVTLRSSPVQAADASGSVARTTSATAGPSGATEDPPTRQGNAPTKKSKRDGVLTVDPTSYTPKNICARDWKEKYPNGTTGAFDDYYKSLGRTGQKKLLNEIKLSKKFGNWVHELSEFQTCFTTHMRTKVPNFKPGMTTNYLCEYVSRAATNDAISRVMLNISVAALHLNYLLKGHIDFAKIEDVVAGLAPEDYGGFARVNVGNFKNPLHIALSLSPILLFLQLNTMTKSIGRARLLCAWRVVGRQKPRDVHRAEHVVWDMLFRIAGGQCSVEDGVTTCLGEILRLDLVQTPWNDWFAQAKAPVPQESPVIALSIHPPMDLVVPLTPISLVDRLHCRTNLQDIESPAGTSTPQTVPPATVNQGVLASGRLVASELPPPPLSLVEPATREYHKRVSTNPSSPPSPLSHSQDVDMDELEEHPRSSNRPQTRRSTPQFTPSEEDEDEEDEEEEEEEEEVPVNKTGKTNEERQSKQPQKREPTSRGGTKGNRNARLNSKSKSKGKGKRVNRRRGADAEDDDDEVQEPPRKKLRTKTPDPSSNTKSPSVNPVKVAREPSTSTQQSSLPFARDAAFQPICARPDTAQTGPLTFKNALNEEVTVQLPFHTLDQKSWFEDMWNAIITNEGQPLYLSEDLTIKNSSCIRVMTRDEFLLESQLLPGYFQQRHIVVTGRDARQSQFNSTALGKVFPAAFAWKGALWFNDQSPIGADCCIYPTSDMMISAHQFQQRSNNGKMVHCHTPKTDNVAPESTLATDIYAGRVSRSLNGPDFYHDEYLRWAEVSTTASYYKWELTDCAGHFETIVCGSRLFFVSRSKTADDTQFLYDPEIVSNHKGSHITSTYWDIEAVIVPAGSDIYIQPHTPHASVCLESSISHGTYFMPCVMIERVIVGVYQSWALTGEEYPLHWAIERASRSILYVWREKFTYNIIDQNEHIPDLQTPEGVRQLFCLCAYRELVNICAVDAYRSDKFAEGLSFQDRRGFIHGRQVSRSLLRWFFGNYALEDSQDTLERVYFKYLAAVVKCLLGQRQKHGNGSITYEQMEELVQVTFSNSPEFLEVYESKEVNPSYGGPLKCTIIRLPESQCLIDWQPDDDDGVNGEDQIWAAANVSAMELVK